MELNICVNKKNVCTLVLDSDSRYLSAEEQSRELTRSISREVAKLSEQWNQLIDHSDNWKHSLDEFMTVSHLNLQSFASRVFKWFKFKWKNNCIYMADIFIF